MIASVEGKVADVAADSLVIEAGGIGYQVFAAPAILASARPTETLKLYTFHQVREDANLLYGFRTPEERGFFTLLLTVTGVGLKVALAIAGRPAGGTSSSRSCSATRPCSWRFPGSGRSSRNASSSSSRRR